jgi:hypothetical protein
MRNIYPQYQIALPASYIHFVSELRIPLPLNDMGKVFSVGARGCNIVQRRNALTRTRSLQYTTPRAFTDKRTRCRHTGGQSRAGRERYAPAILQYYRTRFKCFKQQREQRQQYLSPLLPASSPYLVCSR